MSACDGRMDGQTDRHPDRSYHFYRACSYRWRPVKMECHKDKVIAVSPVRWPELVNLRWNIMYQTLLMLGHTKHVRECDKINRPLFCCPALRSRTAARQIEVTCLIVTPAVKFEMRIIHRIINFCITPTLKTGCAHYTQVRIISPWHLVAAI